MKAIMVMFDSMNRHMLPNYGCEWIKAPNFQRLSQRCLTFDRYYAGSMPCMPARRELHTGRYNFLHRSWGPLEPFDLSMPELLKRNGVHSHLISDHFHYWEDGGATYHTRYSTWEIIRGQQGDPWIPSVQDPDIPQCQHPRTFNLDNWKQDWKNRAAMQHESEQPMPRCYERAMDFLEQNHDADNWFLQIESFDPHEPFFSPEDYKKLYPHAYSGRHYDWINYGKADEDPADVEHIRCQYAALVSMCDHHLGKVLDAMDRYRLWDDTMLIVNTDHGLMLGEKEWYGKNVQPFYQELSHLPFFLYDPRSPAASGRRDALCQTIDIAPTVIDYFQIPVPSSMQGHALAPVVSKDEPVRSAALFGIHGGHVNVTDGQYVYMRANTTADNRPLFDYTLMPTHMRSVFTPEELAGAEFVPAGTLGSIPVPVLRYRSESFIHSSIYGHLLFDVSADEKEEHPLHDAAAEQRMRKILIDQLRESDAPAEQFVRLGLQSDSDPEEQIAPSEQAASAPKSFSAASSLSELMENERTRAVLEQYVRLLLQHPMIAMAKNMSLRQVAAYSKGMLPESLLSTIDEALKQI